KRLTSPNKVVLKSFDDEEVGSHEEGKESNDDSDEGSDKDFDETVKSGAGKDGDEDDDEDDDDDDEEEETAKDDEENKETGKGGDEVRKSGGESEEEKETSEEEEGSFDPIPRTPEDNFVYQVEHKNQKRSNEMNYPRFTKVIIDYFTTRKPSISRRNRIHWHYVRDDALFSTIKVVSRHQTTQQYGAILPIKLTTDEIRNSKAYNEYYACAMGEAAPKPKASARKKKGDSASSTTPPTPTPTTTVESAPRLSVTAKGKQPSRVTTLIEPTDVQRTEAEQHKIVLKRSRQETHISQQSGSGTDEGTDVGGHEEGNKSNESDDDRDEGSDHDSEESVKAGAGKDDDDDDDEDDDDNEEEEEFAKSDEEDKESGKGGDEVRESEGESDEEETRLEEEESFDLIPRTP
nr:hypothetical protein [Tanacetum cinerariifolium]